MDFQDKDLFGLPSQREQFNEELLEDFIFMLLKHAPSNLTDTHEYLNKAWSKIQKNMSRNICHFENDERANVIERVEVKNFWKSHAPNHLPFKKSTASDFKKHIEDIIDDWYSARFLQESEELDFSDSLWKDSKASVDKEDMEDVTGPNVAVGAEEAEAVVGQRLSWWPARRSSRWQRSSRWSLLQMNPSLSPTVTQMCQSRVKGFR